jgi:hypothetical protein
MSDRLQQTWMPSSAPDRHTAKAQTPSTDRKTNQSQFIYKSIMPKDRIYNECVLLTAGETGVLKIFDIETQTLLRQFDTVLGIDSISAMTATWDQEWLFLGSEKGTLVQCPMQERDGRTINKFAGIHDAPIRAMTVTTDSKYLFTSDESGNV